GGCPAPAGAGAGALAGGEMSALGGGRGVGGGRLPGAQGQRPPGGSGPAPRGDSSALGGGGGEPGGGRRAVERATPGSPHLVGAATPSIIERPWCPCAPRFGQVRSPRRLAGGVCAQCVHFAQTPPEAAQGEGALGVAPAGGCAQPPRLFAH